MAIEVKTKRWGNSLGIVIPNNAVEKLHLKPNESIVIEINKKEHTLKELFGSIKFKRSPREMVNNARKDLESKWLS